MKSKNEFGTKLLSLKKRRFSSGDIIFIVIAAILIVYSVALVWLMLWGLFSSFKDYYTDFGLGNVAGFPREWTFSNYATVIQNFYEDISLPDGDYRVNAFGILVYTALYTVGCAFFATASPCVVAYVVSRFGKKFKWLNIYTSIVLVCLILPIVGNVPSEMQIVRALGMYDSIWGMWILKAHFLTMYYLVFLAASSGIPEGYAEAAKIDGAGNFRIFWSVHLPFIRNLFGTIMLILFISFWNDYQTPLLYLESYPTLALWLYKFTTTTKTELSFVPVKATGAMILMIPMLIMFIFTSKKLLGNISVGGIKE